MFFSSKWLYFTTDISALVIMKLSGFFSAWIYLVILDLLSV